MNEPHEPSAEKSPISPADCSPGTSSSESSSHASDIKPRIKPKESITEASEEAEALQLMREKLPTYVTDSFIVTGFDTLKVISEMDCSDFGEIERYITTEYEGDSRFKPGFTVSGNFKFLPGHRKRITNFVSSVKQELTKKLLKRSKQQSTPHCVHPKKRKCVDYQEPVPESLGESVEFTKSTVSKAKSSGFVFKNENQVTIIAKIRQQTVKWQRKQTFNSLRGLKEHEHFTIHADRFDEDVFSLYITCNICGNITYLGCKNENIMLSNWTRHISKCVVKQNMPVYKYGNIKDFFVPVTKDTKQPFHVQTSSSSESSTPLPVSSNNSLHNSDISDTIATDGHDIKSHVDWSRSTRKKMALMKSASDPNQALITSFYDLVDSVDAILNKNPEIGQAVKEVMVGRSVSFPPLFKSLIENAERNLGRVPQKVRHNTLLKKFATSLAIYCGPMAYNFIASNMPGALPSLRTVHRYIAAEYMPFHEGEFRFDELLDHLNNYDAAKIVSLGEDATRVVSRIEYDAETDKLIGFVLPCENNGLPVLDSFLATSFETMEAHFKTGSIAKYAFVYMAQPLTVGVPAFCLACIGTDNKFNADIVLKRWKYIYNELNQRGISLVSVGADGDSRELRAMQVSTQLLSSSQNTVNSTYIGSKISIPLEWKTWFAMKQPTSVTCIQDTVHIAVKLKTRLLKPSIILPFGKFVAGVHHLRIVQQTFSKDEHGLREKDINYKDKQNYEAVLRMTSDSTSNLLRQIPDAKGTVAYLEMVKSINDSYLDMSLDIQDRIQKAWYAVFVLRYWRQWIVLHPQYTLGNNFISNNSYMCVELNAHALIVHLLSLPPESESFSPMLLGSQSCEKLFRAARSMSSTFSTVINFGLLGLLRRLHRLQIQIKLESECEKTNIKYPRVDAHKKKDGYCKLKNTCKPQQ